MQTNNLILVNVDTDSFTACKPDGSTWTKLEREEFIKEINSHFPPLIKWEDDGYYSSIVVIKSKNYALLPEGTNKIKTKGSSIRDQKKEPALREMMDKMIEAMIYDKQDTLVDIYHQYIKEALNVKDISRWCQKKTVTEAVMKCANPKEKVRKQEKDVYDAVKAEPGLQQGDKAYVYPVVLGTNAIPGGISEKTGKPLKDKVEEITGLKLSKYWNSDHNVDHLIDRVYSTVCIFKSVLNMDLFIDYRKKKNKYLLDYVITK